MALTPVAAFGVGDRVDALFGQRWYPGIVDAVLDGGRGYEIIWDDGDEGEVRAAHVRAAPAPARGAARRIFKSEYSIAQRPATEISLGICVHYTYPRRHGLLRPRQHRRVQA